MRRDVPTLDMRWSLLWFVKACCCYIHPMIVDWHRNNTCNLDYAPQIFKQINSYKIHSLLVNMSRSPIFLRRSCVSPEEYDILVVAAGLQQNFNVVPGGSRDCGDGLGLIPWWYLSFGHTYRENDDQLSNLGLSYFQAKPVGELGMRKSENQLPELRPERDHGEKQCFLDCRLGRVVVFLEKVEARKRLSWIEQISFNTAMENYNV